MMKQQNLLTERNDVDTAHLLSKHDDTRSECGSANTRDSEELGDAAGKECGWVSRQQSYLMGFIENTTNRCP
jgi:hypothetical protein